MIDLIILGTQPVEWHLGTTVCVAPKPSAIADWWVKQSSDGLRASFYLFWDPLLGKPDARLVQALAQQKCDVYHAGLRMGMSGQPEILDSVAPLWMFHSDPAPDIPATSWRMSLRACLLRTGVLRQMGGPCPDFETLEGASLEFGHRCITRGALLRHIPSLLPDTKSVPPTPLSFTDIVRFLLYRYGGTWARWALLRGWMRREMSLRDLLKGWRTISRLTPPQDPPPFVHPQSPAVRDLSPAKVSVLIPTVDRYPYLRTLLGQLREQTVAPLEIIIVDQTAADRRDTHLAEQFADLPLRILYQDQPGQCTSRNAGLMQSRGNYILLLDDDIEAPPDLIEKHLRTVLQFSADAASGVAEEVGAEPLPSEMRILRASDVFPAGNTLLSRNVLEKAGLFDLAYNRGQRADGDLGMRVYLSGALMILNPQISVLHHHAPSGGLRKHKARTITYASSRRYLTHRQLLSATEAYMALRYFGEEALRERIWLSVLGTFSVRGGRHRKILKVLVSLCLLPHTLYLTHQRCRQARQMLQEYPQIPALDKTIQPLPVEDRDQEIRST
jgi:glycosyltransferase involved in cell wall biosynthesis